MKTNLILIALLSSLFIGFLFPGCTEDFEEINTNDKMLAELELSTIGNVYGYCQYHGLMHSSWDYMVSQYVLSNFFSQYFANIQTAFHFDRYVIPGQMLDYAWQSFYSFSAANLTVIMEETDPASGVVGFEAQHALLQIWKVYMYHRITDYWGPIPYSEVGNGGISVPYDSQESIYEDFFLTLDAALGVLDQHAGGNAFGTHDQIYGGDIDSWIRFANTLRLRLALRISSIEPGKAQTEAEKAVTGGVITSNDHNGIFHISSPDSPNPLYTILKWDEIRMSAAMESLLKGYNDPRMPVYFSPTVKSVQAGTPEYRGLRNGYTTLDLSSEDLNPHTLSKMGSRWNNYDNNIAVIQAAEAYFLRAEGALKGWDMSGTAEDLYNSGIEMSLSFWGADADTIAAYQQRTSLPDTTHDAPFPVSDVPVRFESDPARQMEQIQTQKWLALYPDAWEAWAELRRTGLPKLYPRMQSDNPDVPADEMIRRLKFTDTEYNTNAAAVEAAKGLLNGPDNETTRLWWNPAK
jgi:hypothetical protein